MKAPNIEELKEKYDVIIKHLRRAKPEATCAILIKDKKVYAGRAECSGKDQFSKKIGRDVALGRAYGAAMGQVSPHSIAVEEWTDLTDIEFSARLSVLIEQPI